jgi:hypothetical protein
VICSNFMPSIFGDITPQIACHGFPLLSNIANMSFLQKYTLDVRSRRRCTGNIADLRRELSSFEMFGCTFALSIRQIFNTPSLFGILSPIIKKSPKCDLPLLIYGSLSILKKAIWGYVSEKSFNQRTPSLNFFKAFQDIKVNMIS